MAKARGDELAFIVPKPVRNKDVFLSKGIDFIVADIREVMEKDGFDTGVKNAVLEVVGEDFDNAVVRQRLLPKYRPVALKNAEERRFAMEHDIAFGYKLRDNAQRLKESCEYIEERNKEVDKKIAACRDMVKLSESL